MLRRQSLALYFFVVRHWLKVSFLLFQAVWMLVILPGHTRGALSAPIAASFGPQLREARSCCGTSIRDDDASSRDKKSPTQDQKNRCPLCVYARGLSPAPVYDFDLRLSEWLALKLFIEPRKTHCCVIQPTYDATAPPIRLMA